MLGRGHGNYLTQYPIKIWILFSKVLWVLQGMFTSEWYSTPNKRKKTCNDQQGYSFAGNSCIMIMSNRTFDAHKLLACFTQIKLPEVGPKLIMELHDTYK